MFKITTLLAVAGVAGLAMGGIALLQYASGGDAILISSGATNIVGGLLLIGFARVIELLDAISKRLKGD